MANRDILQKEQVNSEIISETEEYRIKNAELNEEIKVYETKFAAQEEELNSLTDQCEELDRMLEDKHALIETLDNEIKQAKIAKIQGEEEQKRKLYSEIESKRVIYKPIPQDQIDFLMGIALNECEFYVPTQRIDKGSYHFGTQKITVKIMNDKLVVKAGGSYLLFDEYLKANAQSEMLNTMVSHSPRIEQPSMRRAATGAQAGSPKRSSFTAGSPKPRASPRASKTFTSKN